MAAALRVLDAYCGEGGAARGWADAGWEVTGIDTDPARLARYPFHCLRADALDWIAAYGHRFDAIHASPPCTGYSRGTVALPDREVRYDRLIAATRAALVSTGRPYVLENVAGARGELRDPVLLCGRMFGLEATDDDGTRLVLDRHRLFESNLLLSAPVPHRPHDRSVQVAGAYGGARRDKGEARDVRHGGYVPRNPDVLRALLGAPWLSERGCYLAVPPAYTAHLAAQVRYQLAAA